jgi:hypothetical protein
MQPDDTIRRLQHEKNVWRGIAIGLAVTLILLVALGATTGLFLAKLRAARAEEAAMQAMQERDRAEVEKQKAAQEKRAKQP